MQGQPTVPNPGTRSASTGVQLVERGRGPVLSAGQPQIAATAMRAISRMTYSRLIGALVLSAFVLYGVGLGLATSVVGVGDSLSRISLHQTTLVLGALLMLLNSVAVLSIGVLIFPILENHSKRTAVAYLASRTGEAVFLALGVLALLLTVPWLSRPLTRGRPTGVGPKLWDHSPSNRTPWPTKSPSYRSESAAYSSARCSTGPG